MLNKVDDFQGFLSLLLGDSIFCFAKFYKFLDAPFFLQSYPVIPIISITFCDVIAEWNMEYTESYIGRLTMCLDFQRTILFFVIFQKKKYF